MGDMTGAGEPLVFGQIPPCPLQGPHNEFQPGLSPCWMLRRIGAPTSPRKTAKCERLTVGIFKGPCH